MNLFNLTGKLTIDTSDYEKGIEKVKNKNTEVEKTTKKTGKVSTLAWTAVLTAILAVVKGVANLIVNTSKYADEIGDLAEKWGFASSEIQEFDYWATMSGTTLESLLTGMRGLVNQAEAGADAFKKLGVNVKNTDGTLKDQRTLFLETIDALKQIDNQTERNALQFEIFGRAGIELGQIINKDAEELEKMSKEAEDLGIILSEETIKKAGEFNDSLDRIKLSFQSAMAEFFAGGPDAEQKLQEFFDRMTAQMENWLPQFAIILTKLIEMLIKSVVEALPDILGILIKSINEMPWFEILWNIIKAIIEGLIQAIIGTFEGIFTGKWFGKLFGKGGSSSSTITDGKSFSNIDGLTNSINNATSNSNVGNDNSTTNINIEMTSSNYTEEDAKNLADKLIKEMAIRKQASGR